MSSGEEVVQFQCAGDELLAIHHVPAGDAAGAGVIVVVGGPQYRVGSHRQFVLMARQLAQAGIACMRFDYRGMGDSSGEVRNFEQIDADIRCAVDEMLRRHPGISNVTLLGLCDAASAALMYAPTDQRVAGLILINPWARTEQGKAKATVRHYYLQRMLEPAFWRKLLRGGVRLGTTLAELLRTVRAARAGQPHAGSTAALPTNYLERMRAALSMGSWPVLLTLSGQDMTAREFEDYCRQQPWSGWLQSAGVTQFRLRDADHTFSNGNDLIAATARIVDWVLQLHRRGAPTT